MSGKILAGLFVVVLALVSASAAWGQVSTTPTTPRPQGNSVAPGFGFGGVPAFQAPNVKTPASPALLPAAQPAALTAGVTSPAITPSPAAAPLPARTGSATYQWLAAALAALFLGLLVSLYARPVGAHAAGRGGIGGYYIANWREIAWRPNARR